MPLSAGTRLGPYEILAPIGAGGMGEVYRAHDPRMGRDVAIKVAAERFSDRFSREVHAIAALNHPNICTLYDVGPNYLVMELVEGEAPKGPMPLDDALRIAAQICDALEAAHDKGITHRDLKPANIMITPAGVVKVLDFGLAKAAEPLPTGNPETSPTLSIRATQVGMILGTAAYMSPEQARGKNVDKRADIWAFGVVLYEMLTGERPFQGEDAAQILAAVIAKEPSWEPVPVKVQRLLKRCLEKDPQKRLRDITGVELLLEDVGQVHDLPTTGWTGPTGRSHMPWAVAAALAVISIALGVLLWRGTRPVEPKPLMRFSADLGPEAVEGVNITAAISPDATRLAFVARGPGGKQQLATRLLNQAKATLLPGTDNAADPFFSPDGQWIGFFADGKMKKISVQGGAAVTLCNAPGARGASWGEDGSIVATLSPQPGSGLSRVPAEGGTPQALTKPREKGEVVHRWPQILPGGQAVLFTGNTVPSGYDDANLEVLSLKTGQWKTVQRGGYFGRYLPTSNGAGHLVYVHQGTLFAVGFDLDRLEARGTPAPLLEDVAANAQNGGGQYDVARNGTLVYLSGKASNASWPVAWMDSAGKMQPLLAAPGQYYFPRFSPDGKRLALAVGPFAVGDIQVYDWQRDTMTRLTFTQRNLAPVWTPDGKHIAFVWQYPDGNSIRWIRADGAGEAQLLRDSKGEMQPYSFSPDGQRLAFVEVGLDTGRPALWTLPLDVSDPEHPKPGKPELFLRTQSGEATPAFSPDGRWIAYGSNESGRGEVYVRPFAGGVASGSGKWQISNGGGSRPIWSRNGRELFFYQAQDNRIMVATYTAKADSFAADRPRPWSNTQILNPGPGVQWSTDLAPDGQRFAVFPTPEAASEQKGPLNVTVLLNFFDELRRRVPAGK